MRDDDLPPKPKPRRKGGTPPKEHQFKPGQSGNPGGRPRKKPTMRDAMHTAFDRIVTVPLDGKMQRMTVRDAAANRAIASANDVPTFVMLMKWLEGDRPAADSGAANDDFDPRSDNAVYREAIARGQRRLWAPVGRALVNLLPCFLVGG